MKLKNILLTIWQLPQIALGKIVGRIYKARYCGQYKGVTIYIYKCNGGLSLGKYIFLPDLKSLSDTEVEWLIKHEYGHTLQSKYFGWLYLLLIGLPSLIWYAIYTRFLMKRNVDYSSFFIEKWADKLGEVRR